jgi:hypothetical protein
MAAERVSDIVSGFSFHMSEAWSAEFAVNEMDHTRVHRLRDHRQTTLSVTFAAAGWQSLDSSIDDAVAQLASAVLCTVPPNWANQLRRAFVSGGITRLRRILVSSETANPDPNHYVELCFNKPGFDDHDFHAFYDQLDARLQNLRLGLVDGSSWSREVFCLDISLSQRESGIQSILDFVAEHGHLDSVILLDQLTEERLHG